MKEKFSKTQHIPIHIDVKTVKLVRKVVKWWIFSRILQISYRLLKLTQHSIKQWSGQKKRQNLYVSTDQCQAKNKEEFFRGIDCEKLSLFIEKCSISSSMLLFHHLSIGGLQLFESIKVTLLWKVLIFQGRNCATRNH